MKNLLASIGIIASSTLVVNGESLWLFRANNEASIFADRTASDVGDILTIMIDESTSISTTLSKISNSGGSIGGGGIGALFGIDIGSGLAEDIDVTRLANNSNGNGTVTNVQSVVSATSVMVVDRLPNGNLIIEGAREQIVSGETQYVIVRGMVRKDDIAPDNTVMSSKIANAQIEFLNKGEIASTQKQGWISKLLNIANVW